MDDLDDGPVVPRAQDLTLTHIKDMVTKFTDDYGLFPHFNRDTTLQIHGLTDALQYAGTYRTQHFPFLASDAPPALCEQFNRLYVARCHREYSADNVNTIYPGIYTMHDEAIFYVTSKLFGGYNAGKMLLTDLPTTRSKINNLADSMDENSNRPHDDVIQDITAIINANKPPFYHLDEIVILRRGHMGFAQSTAMLKASAALQLECTEQDLHILDIPPFPYMHVFFVGKPIAYTLVFHHTPKAGSRTHKATLFHAYNYNGSQREIDVFTRTMATHHRTTFERDTLDFWKFIHSAINAKSNLHQDTGNRNIALAPFMDRYKALTPPIRDLQHAHNIFRTTTAFIFGDDFIGDIPHNIMQFATRLGLVKCHMAGYCSFDCELQVGDAAVARAMQDVEDADGALTPRRNR